MKFKYKNNKQIKTKYPLVTNQKKSIHLYSILKPENEIKDKAKSHNQNIPKRDNIPRTN